MPQVLIQALQSIKALSVQARRGQVNQAEILEGMKKIQDRIGKDLKQGAPKEEKKEEKKEKKISDPK